MNILLLTTHLNPGGVSSYIISLAQGIKSKGHNLYIASSGGSYIQILHKSGIKHIDIPIRTKSELSPKILISFWKLRKIIKENKIQIVHAQTRVTQVLAFLLSKFTKIVFVSTGHGFFKPKLFRRIFPCWGERTIAISNQVKNHLINDFKMNQQKIDVIYNGIDTSIYPVVKDPIIKSEIKNKFGLDNKVVIGILARLSPVKGHKVLLSAFKEITKIVSNVVLFVVGDGPSKKDLENLVKKLYLEEQVVFHAPVIHTSKVLSAMDIFCMPSLQEGLGLAILEAQASGIPVIASSIGGIREVIADNKTGILVAPSDSDALKNAILDLINNSLLRKSLTENALISVKEKFSLDEMIDKTERVYNHALS